MATFKAGIAYDPLTAELVPNASLQVFAEADTNFVTPLTVTLVADGSSVTSVPTNAQGAYGAFSHGTETLVFIKSGGYVTALDSIEGVRDDADASRVAAEAAAAAAAAAGVLPGGGSTGQVLAKTSGADGAVAWTSVGLSAHQAQHLVGGSDPLVGLSMSQVTDLTSTLTGVKDYYDVIYDEGSSSWPAPPSNPSPPFGFKWWRFTSRQSVGAAAPQTQSTSGKDWTFLTSVGYWVWRPYHTVDPT